MQAPTSTDARSSEAASCREKNPVSRGEHVVSHKRSGRLCCWISILATLPGTNSWATSDSSRITGPGARKTIVGPFERAIALAGDCFVWLLWPTDEYPRPSRWLAVDVRM